MTNRRAAFVSIVGDDADDEDIDKITSYCQYCESLGFYHKLGPRIYPEGPKPYDADKWLQCYNCGTIIPRVHSKQENEIAPIVDPPETIHDSGKVVVLATHKRTKAKNSIFEKIKKSRPGYNRSNNYTDIDSDLRVQLNSGKKLVSYNSTNDGFEG